MLRPYLIAGYPFIWMRTPEPDRVLVDAAMGNLVKGRKELYSWDGIRGIREYDPENKGWTQVDDPEEPTAPTQIAAKMATKPSSVWFLMNFHWWAKEASVIQSMLNYLGTFKAGQITGVVVSPMDEIPMEMNRDFVLLDYALPDRAALEVVYVDLFEEYKDKLKTIDVSKSAVLDALAGLTLNEAENAIAFSIAKHREIIPKTLLEMKAQMVQKNAALQFHRSPFFFRHVGGNETLKDWLLQRFDIWHEDAPPRGCIVLGVPGTGKSMTAQALANEVNWPCLELAFGRVFGSLVGESERMMRAALSTVDAMAPCILYIDEIDKGLAGVGGQSNDGGTTQRVGGTFLTWLQDHTSKVFVIATANDISKLPSEYKRAGGRWDQVFWVDLPNPIERKAILEVYAQEYYKKGVEELGITKLIGTLDNYTGAEIRQVMVESLYCKNFDLAAKLVVPISKSQRSSIERMRNTAKESGWLLASRRDESQEIKIGKRRVQLDG